MSPSLTLEEQVAKTPLKSPVESCAMNSKFVVVSLLCMVHLTTAALGLSLLLGALFLVVKYCDLVSLNPHFQFVL